MDLQLSNFTPRKDQITPYDFETKNQICPTFKMAPNQYGGQSNMADITKTSNISHLEQNHIN